jgi:hypothetical protein
VADGVGLLASAVMTPTVLNITPGLEIPPLWQLFTLLILGTVNLVAWKQGKLTPVSLYQAGKWVTICTLILAGVGAIDTLFGFLMGHRNSAFDAFINSGPFGGITDAFLLLCGLLFGVPALAHAVGLYYSDRRST